MSSKSDIALVAYVASPHDGYLQLFRNYPNADLYVLGKNLISEFPSLTRHLPGNRPEDACRMIEALRIVRSVRILNTDGFEALRAASRVVMPDEDVAHALAEKYLPGVPVFFDGSWRLRWDWGATTKARTPEGEIPVTADELAQALMRKAQTAAEQSPDWWRQVGVLMARDGKPLLVGFNRHVPSDQTLYVGGDPRSNFEAGQCIDMSGALHGEIDVIASAASRGVKTEGCDLYVSTFPCPPCAGAIAAAKFRRLYYAEGYSLIHGADTLRAKGVELFRVHLGPP